MHRHLLQVARPHWLDNRREKLGPLRVTAAEEWLLSEPHCYLVPRNMARVPLLAAAAASMKP